MKDPEEIGEFGCSIFVFACLVACINIKLAVAIIIVYILYRMIKS
jgi:hypothetical protein